MVRNDAETVDELLERARGGKLIVSPGPCTPNEAGVSVEAIRRFGEERIPVLGVCLGHQSIGAAFGGRVVRGEPVHGKTATIEHDGKTIFAGLDGPLEVGRYHSLVIDPDLPPELGALGLVRRHRAWPSATASCRSRACSSTRSRC